MAVALLVTTTAVAQPSHGAIYPIVEQINGDVRLVRMSVDVAVEQIRGQTAATHLRSLLSRRPEAFVRSREVLRSRGHESTEEVFVERTLRRLSGVKGDASPNQYVQSSSEQNADGEIVFWSYDGPGYTWQGTIYVETYSDGAAATWDGQIDTSTEDHAWVWHENTWSSEGGPRDKDPVGRDAEPPRPGETTRGIQLASHRLLSVDASGPTFSGIVPVRFDLATWADCWRTGVVTGCTTAAVGCMRVKAGWPACFALWCLGAEIGSAIGCAL
jgi:hypothetical protein